jgi:hypothetical protein
MANRNKEIRERATRINTAWKQGASAAVFKRITQPVFETELVGAAADEQEIADIEAQLKMKKTALEERYKGIGNTCIDVRDGVEGHADFGGNHPIMEAMGFVRFSARKSGLTRKKTGAEPPKS